MNTTVDLQEISTPPGATDELARARVERKVAALLGSLPDDRRVSEAQISMIRRLTWLVQDMEDLCRQSVAPDIEQNELARIFATAQELGSNWGSATIQAKAAERRAFALANTYRLTGASPETCSFSTELPPDVWRGLLSDTTSEAAFFARAIAGFWVDVEAFFMAGVVDIASHEAEIERVIATWEEWAEADAAHDARRRGKREGHGHEPGRRRVRLRPNSFG